LTPSPEQYGFRDLQDSTIATRHLDGLRIVAASAVVVLHYSDYIKDAPFGRFMVDHTWHFNLFVDLFFVISGFVIASQYLGKAGSPAAVGRFLWRRLARIYPLHLATLAFYIVIALALHAGVARADNPARYPWSDLPAQFLLLHAIDGARLTFNFPSWSLSAELFCYVLFPIIVLMITRSRRAILMLVALPLLANTIFALTAGTEPWPDWINQGGAFRALPAFNLGIACYLYRDRLASLPMVPGLLNMALVVFVLFGSNLPIGVALGAIYLIALIAIQHDLSGRTTLFARLGFERWSSLTYSSYMLHIPIATVVFGLLGRFIAPLIPGGRVSLVPVAIAILAIASHLSLRYFETPMRRILNDAYDRIVSTRIAAAPLPRRT
jgi:peptidoglycan/LPS O-acetylase OafA/YrhL